MRRLVLTAWAAAVLVMAEAASAQSRPAGFFSVSGRGESGWTIACTTEEQGGQKRESRIQGRFADRQVYITRNRVSGATCSFAAPAEGTFDLRVNTEDFACPFEGVDPLNCVRHVGPGQSGEITVRLQE